MFEVSETPRTPRTNSFVQMSARRTNGDKVYITGDSRQEVEHVRRLLMKAARRSGLRMLEIAEMAEVVSIVMDNPGAPVLGIAKAPHPYAEINGGVAWEQFLIDIERTTAILDDDDTGIDVIAWIAEWQAGWCRFWSHRHPDPARRESFARALSYNRGTQQPKIRARQRWQ
jgi:hypothetical protein